MGRFFGKSQLLNWPNFGKSKQRQNGGKFRVFEQRYIFGILLDSRLGLLGNCLCSVQVCVLIPPFEATTLIVVLAKQQTPITTYLSTPNILPSLLANSTIPHTASLFHESRCIFAYIYSSDLVCTSVCS